ncbi:MAG: fibronectin type III domain-containing protein [Candidatus Dadabacteria bacterium]|nr:fibronectin type III domain-containing protein [Candidatus Dadabacteria bacterium]
MGNGTVRVAGDVGQPVTSTDQDGDSLSYSLQGTDAGKFSIVSGSGQIRTRVGEKYDRESKASYSVMVKADDGKGGTDTIEVNIDLTNIPEPPAAPAAPSVFSGTASSVNVMWNPPANAGRPAITDYDLQYRRARTTNWINGPQDVTRTTATISDLTENESYEVRIRARNSDGNSAWSSPGAGRTNAQGNQNNAPEFSGMSATRSFSETMFDATSRSADNVGNPVRATDRDSDALSYSLQGTDAGKFSIVSGSGQIRTRVGEKYDRESKASYSVMVKADDGKGGTDTIAVNIDLTNIPEPPAAPRAPSVSSSGARDLNVMWNPPANAGRPDITGYRVRYRLGTSGSWMEFTHSGTGTSATITVSNTNVRYQVQVRAMNSEGSSSWSQSGRNSVVSSPSSSSPSSSPPSSSSPSSSPPPPPPVMEAAEVSTNDELKEFVVDAAGRIKASGTFENTLRLLGAFRDKESGWNNGSMYLILLTKRGGVYFHANNRQVEDLDWSEVLFCEAGGPVLDSQGGCFIEYDGASSAYAHPFSASHVPLAHGEEEFVLLGGFDQTPEGKTLMGEIKLPSTEAGEVDTDNELREFVEDAGESIREAIENPDIDPAELRGILRREGPWREEDVHVYIMDEMGIVMFDGADRSREQKNEYAKQYIRDIIQNAGEEIVSYAERGLSRRGYSVRVEVPLDEIGEDSRVYIVGSGYQTEEQQSSSSGGGGGGCAIGENSNGSTSGMFLVLLTLLLAVLLKRHSPQA